MDAEKIILTINKTLSLNLDPSSVPGNESLRALGIDSLDFYNVLLELESETGKKVSDEDSDHLLTIDDLTRFFS